MFAEYEDETEQKAYAELPGQSKPVSGPPPAAVNVSPEMARAMEQFPQWTQEESKATLTRDGALKPYKTGSTVSEGGRRARST